MEIIYWIALIALLLYLSPIIEIIMYFTHTLPCDNDKQKDDNDKNKK